MGQTGSALGHPAPRSSGSSGGTNNLPPLLFHQVHGDNVRISRDGAVARRAESFCKGIAFSARPVKVAEKVCVKFLDVSNNWSGVIRFGFTANDPSTLRYGLPKYACPDLTNKPGYWAKALAERFAERDTVLFFYVTQAGDVHFGINGEEKGVFFSGVETRSPLWAIVDLYGNSTAIEFVDPRHQLNNSRRNLSGGGGESPDAVERLILPLTALSVNQQNQQQPRCVVEEEAAPARCQPPPPPPPTTTTYYNPLPFHRTRGRNVRMSNDRCVASRADTEFCHGYVFTSRPLQLGERLVIQVLATEPMYVGSLAFGLTSCDPASLQAADLPDDSDQLLDRHEYWVVSKDVAGGPQRGDELAFCVSPSGEVTCSKNGAAPFTLMHVDQSLQLWAFVDVYGTTQKIRVLGSTAAPRPRNSTPPLRVAMPLGAVSPTSPPPRFCVPAGPEVAHASAELVQFQPAMGGGTVLVVNLPPAHSNYLNQQNQQNQHLPAMLAQEPQPATSGTLLSTYSHTYIEPVSGTYSTLDSTTSLQQWAEATAAGGGGGGGGSECTICYERPIDSVLYMCGHMCMCFECAVQQWRGKGGGHCPLCRAAIRDVIRTYKS